MIKKIIYKTKQLSVSIYSYLPKRNPRLWAFGEWYGTKANDNACFFANYISNHCGNSFKLVWIANKDADTHLLNKKIKIIERGTPQAKRILLKAGVAITNQGTIDLDSNSLNYVKGSVYINFWHGVPWKHVFSDQYNTKISALTKIKLEYNHAVNEARYWLSPSTDMQKIIYRANFVSPQDIIKAGYPRNSLFYDRNTIKILKEKVRDSIHASSSSKIIAYMPTFRDAGDKVFSFEDLSSDMIFISWLEENDIYIIQKAHFVNRNKIQSNERKTDRIITDNNIAAFELMAASNILVTDYSSCFFDYLILDRPIVHFIYDYEKYRDDDRGLYYSADEVCCGDAVKSIDRLKESLKANIAHPDKDKELRERRRKRFINYESDHSCEDIYQFVKKKVEEKYHTTL